MISPETKNDYIKMVNDAYPQEHVFKDIFIDFIKTYDGTNEGDFKKLLLGTVVFLMERSELEIYGESLSDILDNEKNYDTQLAHLKEDYELLKKGIIPSQPPVPSSEEDDQSSE